MRKWKYRLDFADLFEAYDAEEMTVLEVAREAFNRLKNLNIDKEDSENILYWLKDLVF